VSTSWGHFKVNYSFYSLSALMKSEPLSDHICRYIF